MFYTQGDVVSDVCMQNRHVTRLSKAPSFGRQCLEGVLYLQRGPQDCHIWSLCPVSSCLLLCHALVACLGSQPHTAFQVHWPFPLQTEKADISMNHVSSFGEHGFSHLPSTRLSDFSFTQTLAVASFPYSPRFAFFFTGRMTAISLCWLPPSLLHQLHLLDSLTLSPTPSAEVPLSP